MNNLNKTIEERVEELLGNHNAWNDNLDRKEREMCADDIRQALTQTAEEAKRAEKGRISKIIDGLKTDERKVRIFTNYDGQDWEARTYNDKQLVNAAYNHLKQALKD